MQVNPLFQEPLDIPSAWMPAIKAGVMFSIASAQLVNTRSLVQSYLNTGLKQWHSMKHGSQGSAAASGARAGDKIKMKLMVVNGLFVKVSMQGRMSINAFLSVCRSPFGHAPLQSATFNVKS